MIVMVLWSIGDVALAQTPSNQKPSPSNAAATMPVPVRYLYLLADYQLTQAGLLFSAEWNRTDLIPASVWSTALEVNRGPSHHGMTALEAQVFDRLMDEVMNRLSMNNQTGATPLSAPDPMDCFLRQFSRDNRALYQGTSPCKF